jgi:hypothetical protein
MRAFARVAPAGHALVGCKLPCLRSWLASEPGSREPKMTPRPGSEGTPIFYVSSEPSSLQHAVRSRGLPGVTRVTFRLPLLLLPPPLHRHCQPWTPLHQGLSRRCVTRAPPPACGASSSVGRDPPERWPLFLRRHPEVWSRTASPLVGGRVVRHIRGGRRQGKWLADGHQQGKLE